MQRPSNLVTQSVMGQELKDWIRVLCLCIGLYDVQIEAVATLLSDIIHAWLHVSADRPSSDTPASKALNLIVTSCPLSCRLLLKTLYWVQSTIYSCTHNIFNPQNWNILGCINVHSHDHQLSYFQDLLPLSVDTRFPDCYDEQELQANKSLHIWLWWIHAGVLRDDFDEVNLRKLGILLMDLQKQYPRKCQWLALFSCWIIKESHAKLRIDSEQNQLTIDIEGEKETINPVSNILTSSQRPESVEKYEDSENSLKSHTVQAQEDANSHQIELAIQIQVQAS